MTIDRATLGQLLQRATVVPTRNLRPNGSRRRNGRSPPRLRQLFNAAVAVIRSLAAPVNH